MLPTNAYLHVNVCFQPHQRLLKDARLPFFSLLQFCKFWDGRADLLSGTPLRTLNEVADGLCRTVFGTLDSEMLSQVVCALCMTVLMQLQLLGMVWVSASVPHHSQYCCISLGT